MHEADRVRLLRDKRRAIRPYTGCGRRPTIVCQRRVPDENENLIECDIITYYV